jgi:chemotaxis protein MotB
LREQVAALENELTSEKEQKVVLESGLSARDARVEELEEENKGLNSTILDLKNQVAEGKREQDRLKSRTAELLGTKSLTEEQMAKLKSTYTNLVTDLQQQIQNREVTIEELEEKLSITFVDRILFDFGRATIKREGRKILTKVGETLKNVGDKKIRVVGHTDSVPISQEYKDKYPSNWELSAARAAAVVRFLKWKCQIEPESMEAVGRSFHEPVASNDTEEGRARNRRVEIIISPR